MRCVLLLTALLGAGILSGAAGSPAWTVNAPVLLPGAAGSFDETAVKDPSIVRFGGRWHVFYTARGRGEYTLGYASSRSLAGLRTARRTQLTQLHGKSAYAAAPQVFYFRPQKKWYLVFQTTDTNYQPVYSTTATIDRPESWTAPAPLVEKQDKAKWIDFWVICDRDTAYLFFTRAHKEVVVMTTPAAEFPQGFRDMRPVFSPLIEAAHVYRDRQRYLMLFETADGAMRRFGLATASSPAGPWTLADAAFATGAQLRHGAGERWTEEVSHGELLRAGYDETLEADAVNMRLLIQGMPRALHKGDYPSLPWRLGVIESRRSAGKPR